MEKSLISFEEYEFFLKSGRPYSGYVWTKEGKIFEVKEDYVTMVQPKPIAPFKSYGDSHRTVFFDVIKHPQISLLNLGSDDVLYDMNGNFVSVIEATDPVKGEIKILKSQVNFSAPISWSEEQRKEYEIVDLKYVTLSAEAYSKIFTHILSLMGDVDLSKIRNKKVGVQLYKEGFWWLYNLDSASENAQAFHDAKQNNVIAAVITRGNVDNDELYRTLWNVQNLLGAHELIGHSQCKLGDDDTGQHHLVYLLQMGHGTWKNTTDSFKQYQKGNLKDIYNKYRGPEDLYNEQKKNGVPIGEETSKKMEEIKMMRNLGWFPRDFNNTDGFDSRMEKETQKWNPYNKKK